MKAQLLLRAGTCMFMYEDAWKTDSEFEHCVVNPKYVLKGLSVRVGAGSVSWLTLIVSP